MGDEYKQIKKDVALMYTAEQLARRDTSPLTRAIVKRDQRPIWVKIMLLL